MASSFYTAALEKPFLDALTRHDDGRQVLVVPYNQLYTFLLNPGSVISEGDLVKVILLLRVEDLIRFELAERGTRATTDSEYFLRLFRQRSEEFLDVLSRVSHLRLSIMMCPSGRGAFDVSFLGTAIRIAEQKILAAFRSQQRHLLLSWTELERGSNIKNWFNVPGDRLAHVPFTPEGLDGIADFFLAQAERMPTQSMAADPTPTVDLERFLTSLELRMAITPLTDQDGQRVVDLVRHTTHFINAPGLKVESGNLRNIEGAMPEGQAWVVRVSDRFGDYGVSGMVSFAVEHGSMRVGLLFLSCPVLGKQVEHAFLSWLTDFAERQGAKVIEVPFLRGRDNEIMCRLLARLQSAGGDPLPCSPGAPHRFRIAVPGLADRLLKEAPSPTALSEILARMQFAEANA